MAPPRKTVATKDYLNLIIATQARLAQAEFNLKAFMQLVVEQMQKLTPATGVVIELIDGNEVSYQTAVGSISHYSGLKLPMGNSISGLCVRQQKVLYCDDTELDPRVNLAVCRKIHARSLMVAPLMHKGQAVGVLKIVANVTHAFNKSDAQTLQLMAGFIGSALAHQITHQATKDLLSNKTHALAASKKNAKQLHRLAHEDFLTGLANRKKLNDELKAILTASRTTPTFLALLYLDMDGFKAINDNLGHDAGDILLKAFAKRLRSCIKDSDIIARLGGDEFIVLLENTKKPANVINIVKKILASMAKRYKLGKQLVKVTVSIGITYHHGDKITSTALINQADQALYEAKQAGKNRYKVFKVAR